MLKKLELNWSHKPTLVKHLCVCVLFLFYILTRIKHLEHQGASYGSHRCPVTPLLSGWMGVHRGQLQDMDLIL